MKMKLVVLCSLGMYSVTFAGDQDIPEVQIDQSMQEPYKDDGLQTQGQFPQKGEIAPEHYSFVRSCAALVRETAHQNNVILFNSFYDLLTLGYGREIADHEVSFFEPIITSPAALVAGTVGIAGAVVSGANGTLSCIIALPGEGLNRLSTRLYAYNSDGVTVTAISRSGSFFSRVGRSIGSLFLYDHFQDMKRSSCVVARANGRLLSVPGDLLGVVLGLPGQLVGATVADLEAVAYITFAPIIEN